MEREKCNYNCECKCNKKTNSQDNTCECKK
jgi:hypothetical protein